jgi:hypothetical protein
MDADADADADVDADAEGNVVAQENSCVGDETREV